MVSTRGIKSKYAIGEKVLCYEPDPTKAKVLYDSKVMEVVEGKDKKGRRCIEYLIHFQGWNSSWDRTVNEDFVLKDTDKNRQLQRDLAEKSQLQIGAYLYRKERKKRKREPSQSGTEVKQPFLGSSDDGSSCCSTNVGAPPEEPMDTSEVKIDQETESCCSSVESVIEDDRVALRVSERMKNFLEMDFNMITKNGKLVNLPAKVPVVTILENFVKYYSVKSIFGPHPNDAPKRRNSAAKSEKREKDYDKLKTSINLRKEVADGLRIYFDFLLKDYLLYRQEKDQANNLLSAESLTNFTYIGSERQSLEHIFSLKQGTPNTPFGSTSDTGSETPVSLADTSMMTDDNTAKRRLRSHKNADESEYFIDFNTVKSPDTSVGCKSSTSLGNESNYMSYISLLKELIPPNAAITFKARELLQNILSWQILPSDAPPEPSMIYGCVHLSRLIVKLPEFLNATTMPDEKLKVLLKYIDGFIDFFENQRELFGEHQYKDAIHVPQVKTPVVLSPNSKPSDSKSTKAIDCTAITRKTTDIQNAESETIDSKPK